MPKVLISVSLVDDWWMSGMIGDGTTSSPILLSPGFRVAFSDTAVFLSHKTYQIKNRIDYDFWSTNFLLSFLRFSKTRGEAAVGSAP